jgi:predicted membrane GTPase involved in stress response
MAATLTLSPSVTVVRRDTLFVTDAILSVVATTYDAMPNGHFVMVKGVMSTTPPVIVFGWVDEMKETVAAAEKEQ